MMAREDELRVDDSSCKSDESSESSMEEVEVVSTENSSRHDSDNCGQSTSSGSMGREMSEVEAIAREDTIMLRIWRRVVAVVILVTFGTVLTGAIIFLKKEESDSSHQSYLLSATTAAVALERKLEEYIIVMEHMAESITVSGRGGNNFPFVSLPSFEVEGSQARALTNNDVITWAPLITESQRKAWSNFSTTEQGWYKESVSIVHLEEPNTNYSFAIDDEFRDFIWKEHETDVIELPHGAASTMIAPLWESSPPPISISSCNYNLLEETEINSTLSYVLQYHDAMIGKVKVETDNFLKKFLHPELSKFTEEVDIINHHGIENVYELPHSIHIQPVFSQLNNYESKIVGFLLSLITWDHFLADLVHEKVSGIVAVLENSCDQAYTYELFGSLIVYVGEGDLHDADSNATKVTIPINFYLKPNTTKAANNCIYSISLYKSKNFNSGKSETNLIIICSLVAVAAFLVMGMTFFTYDRFVRSRNSKIVYAAARSNAIISSMFPTQVRDRLFAEKDEKKSGKEYIAQKTQLKSMMTSKERETADMDERYKDKPIADLFLDTSILFADIVGFTAWSSVREPSQVFVLLETIFQAFDDLARKRRVFKVETVGDCYVAVAGLPEPRKDHAVVMARFAHDCMVKMHSLVKKLELTLGPETGELSMRMGIHSGPVTAGVLRGDRSRFQLFGDTMNTASRMEHTGLRDKIQISQETAHLLSAAGKVSWVSSRDGGVDVKGKGEMKTYWLEVSRHQGNSNSISDRTTSTASADLEAERKEENGNDFIESENVLDSKTSRLVQWNVDVLLRLLKQIVAHRQSVMSSTTNAIAPKEERYQEQQVTCCLDEVKEIITLPGFREATHDVEPEDVTIDENVTTQLQSYLTRIALLYRRNPFHNFEHASHVTMSVGKLLSRIVAPQDFNEEASVCSDIASTLHDHTYGITSDPLTQFSCVLSALIHDVDHPGVPNLQLVKEGAHVATLYQNKSPAEQNSVDLAWNLLMEDEFKDFRAAIYSTDAELIRFRQLIVNSVMATDIADRELKILRNLRWDRAFSSTTVDANPYDAVNRKATIVIEHLIQASDVAHTMQHWHIYRKWNERFFLECYEAYKNGRSDNNPADGWYEGEMGFYDFYIIPLAKKLKDCGVFGVSSDEYLNYAIRNRQEWETRGREIVNEMMELVAVKDENPSPPILTSKMLDAMQTNQVTATLPITPPLNVLACRSA